MGILRRVFGTLRLVEQGSVRWCSRRGYVLVRVHDGLRYYLALRGPEADSQTTGELRRAQGLIEDRIGCIPLPPEGRSPTRSAPELLADANALCAEYLSSGRLGTEGRVSRLVAGAHARESEGLRGVGIER